MSDTLFVKNSTKILATWLNDVNTNTYSAANKAALALLTPALGLKVFVSSSDGGLFKAVVGAAATTYSDNGGAYCGTITIPTGGDGSIAWVSADACHVLGFNAKSWGVTIDGTTNDTANAQVAVDYISSIGGGKLNFDIGTSILEGLVPKDHVWICGQNKGILSSYSGSLTGSELKAAGAGGNIIDQTAGTLRNFAMSGFLMSGVGSSIACKGISLVDADRANLTELSFNNFADNAIKIEAGAACDVEKIFAQNCLLNRTRSQKDGVVDINGTDHWFNTSEITASLAGVSGKSSASLYCCAVAIHGTNHFIHDLVAEISDIGMYLTCDNSRISDIRGDLNQGHGWELVGAKLNKFSNCDGYRNSVDTTNTYNQWEIDSASGNNQFANCNGDAVAADSWAAAIGFNDAVNSATTKNIYVNCGALLNATSSFVTAGAEGSAVVFPTGVPKAFTLADATPSVDQYCSFRTSDTTTYTNFDDGLSGQTIHILALHAATLTNNATIKPNTGANKVLVVNKRYTLTNYNGVWYEDE